MNQVVPNEPRPNILAGGKVAAIIPQSMDEAYRLAKAVCMAGMAPKGMEKPEQAMIAIMRGLEIGLTPFQALDRIAVVNGRPTIFGDGAIALVRGSGTCEFIRETVTGEGDSLKATCIAKRKGETEAITGTFSVADAKKAGLWGKSGPWQQYPARMLQMRARGFCLRDGFADVLGGLYLREEIEDSARPAPPPRPTAAEAPPAPSLAPPRPTPPNPNRPASAPPKPQEPPKPTPFDIAEFRAAYLTAETDEAREAVYEREVTLRQPPLSDDEMDAVDAVTRESAPATWEGE
jgi:hypothetical protein